MATIKKKSQRITGSCEEVETWNSQLTVGGVSNDATVTENREVLQKI